MLILTVKGYELPVCSSLTQGQAVTELMKTLMYQKVDDWHQCASWRECWGTLVHSKWQCPETQFRTLHLFSPSIAISPSAYCLHQQCQNSVHIVLNFYTPITREFFLVWFVMINLRPLYSEYVIMFRKTFFISNSEHPERMKRNYC